MTTKADLVDFVSDVIQDESYVDATILAYINRGIRQIAGGMLISYPDRTQLLSSPLPNLLTSDDLTTDTTLPYVAMPSDFGRALVSVTSAATNSFVDIMSSFAEFLQFYPTLDSEANVNAVAVRGARLYYQGIPAVADTLTVHYYSTPTELVDDADIPTCLPTHLHEELLVNYAAMLIFDQIEDGIEGQKVNFQNCQMKFDRAMLSLESFNDNVPAPVVFM